MESISHNGVQGWHQLLPEVLVIFGSENYVNHVSQMTIAHEINDIQIKAELMVFR